MIDNRSHLSLCSVQLADSTTIPSMVTTENGTGVLSLFVSTVQDERKGYHLESPSSLSSAMIIGTSSESIVTSDSETSLASLPVSTVQDESVSFHSQSPLSKLILTTSIGSTVQPCNFS